MSSNRIVKETAKVIVANDVVPVMYSMLDPINVCPKDNINHVNNDWIDTRICSLHLLILDPQPPYGPDRGSGIYVNQQPFDGRTGTPLTIVLDGNQREQRIPLQVLVCDH